MNIRRGLFLIIGIAILLISAPVVAQDKPKKMSFWIRDTSFLIDTLVDKWNASHEYQIELTVIPASDFVTKFAAAIAGGQAPDIASIDLIYTPAFAAQGQLEDITDKVQSLPFLKDLSPAHMTLGTYDGHNYAVPFAAEGSFLIYNKGLFKQAGLDPEKPPTNWEELLTDARAITALGNDTYGYYFAGNCAGCNAFTYLPLIWASGGDVLSADFSKPTLTDPIVHDALQLYRTMWEEKLIPEGAQVDDGANFVNAFGTGKIGMAGTGAFGINTYKKDFPDLDFGVTLLPGKEGGTASFGGGDVIGIPKGSVYVDQAWEFIEWVLSDEVQLEVYAANNNLPLRLSLADNKYFKEDPRLATAASTLSVGHTPYSVVYNDLFNDKNGPWLLMLQTAIFDGDIDGAITEAQKSFSDIMAK
jgi:multiple sugar transport system substrate-binding protein